MRASFLIYLFCFLSAAAIIFAINTESSAAAGFGVSPSTLDFTVEEGSESSRQLIIYNTGKESEFIVKSSSPELLRAFPLSGTLPEGGTTAVTLTAFGKKIGTSKSEITVSVNSRDNGRIGVALGAVVAVNINIIKSSALSANAFFGMLLSASIVMFGVSGYCASRRRIRQLLFVRA